jgi:aldehyde oxidoreductase
MRQAQQKEISFYVNGVFRSISAQSGASRLSDVLRNDFGMTGTKVGCHAGDCGACTVLVDDDQVCACIVPVGQLEGCKLMTVEGLANDPIGATLQQAFLNQGAAQCGICTPGMLMAARDLLSKNNAPLALDVEDALGGVLCRCTGYVAITAAVLEAALTLQRPWLPPVSKPVVTEEFSESYAPVGLRVQRLDGAGKVDGSELFGADAFPAQALTLCVLRSPVAHAKIKLNQSAIQAFVKAHGLTGVVTADDIPNNAFAIFADMRDQPAIAGGAVMFLGEAVLALVGNQASVESALGALGDKSSGDHSNVVATAHPLFTLEPLDELLSISSALAPGAAVLQTKFQDNVLCRGRVAKNWQAQDGSSVTAQTQSFSASMETDYVEHAYIEPEAGYAQWDAAKQRLTVFACTQTPYMDRDELAHMFALPKEQVRIIPSAVGGGFGGKLDLSLQPLIAAAAIKFKVPVKCVFDRPESMRSSTKRHPAQMRASLTLDAAGNLFRYEFEGDFNTGPYASWGPTVANRVPIHACGPYRFSQVLAQTRAVLTNNSIGGAFRGFGVPQSTLLNERLIDEAAVSLHKDPLEFRFEQSIRAGDTTATGQVLEASVGLQECLAALRPAWAQAKLNAENTNRTYQVTGISKRRGIGIASMWYGIGNTVIANPSSMRVGLRPNGRVVLYNGAVDIGQGTYTVMPQMCAQALGLPLSKFDQVRADTDLTLDAGKSSASRQTFVSGNAAKFAGQALRLKLLRLLGIEQTDFSTEIELKLIGSVLSAGHAAIDVAHLPVDAMGDVCFGQGYFNPPTVPLDADGQGVPYATYGFAAQFVELEVDLQLGTVQLLHIHAAHDVGKAINPTLVEGQIYGGVAQGIGLALMERYIAGKTDNLHDYLIPTIGDVPPITTYLIEDGEPLGPFGAKGVGEPALVATAPAILNAIAFATGCRMNQVPVTPDRLRQSLKNQI